MARTEIIIAAKKAANAWRNTDTYHQAAQIIDMLVSELEGEPTLTPPNEWVRVEERLPEEKQRVIVRCERVGTSVGWILWGRWMTDIGPHAGDVTHWMPLPAPPDKDNHVPAKTPNDPLTLEQLREMDEIPIYVVTEKYGSGWCVLNWHGVKKSYTYFSRTGTSEGMTATPLSAKTYGDLWIAYRRPPEGAEIQPSKQARAGALCGIQII